MDASIAVGFLLNRRQAEKFRYGNPLIMKDISWYYVRNSALHPESESSAAMLRESYLLAKATPLPSGAYEFFGGPIG